MRRGMLAIIVAVLAVFVIGAMILANSKDDTKQTTTTDSADVADEATDESQTPSNEQATTPAETASVDITNMAFSPATITVKKGTNVTWTNMDSVGHTVTPNNPTDEFKGSETLNNGEMYSVTFNTPGTYTYFCTPHPQMKGTVVVTE